MNVLTRFDAHEDHIVSHPGPYAVIHPPEIPERLKPARGLVVGLAISVAFWVLVGIGAFLFFHT